MTTETLHTDDMATDEKKIRAGYFGWASLALPFAPLLVAAYVDDTKWVIAVGFAVLIYAASDAGGRLHDLCIRLRRTNEILSKPR